MQPSDLWHSPFPKALGRLCRDHLFRPQGRRASKAVLAATRLKPEHRVNFVGFPAVSRALAEA